jgi:replicative DNA helicase
MINSNLYDIGTESAVLSAMMMGNNPTGTALEHLQIDHFYDHKHKIIFKAMKQMYEQDINIDALTLMDFIKRHNLLKSEEERDYLTDLMDVVVSDTNLQYHIDIVK